MAEALPRPVDQRWTPLAHVSPHFVFAVRFAVAVCASLSVAQLPGLATNSPSWILITVIMVAQPISGGALKKGALRMLGTVVAGLGSVLVFGWFSQDPPWLLACFFLIQVVGAYGFSGSRYQYAWFVLAFTSAIILADAIGGAGAVETVAFQRVTMVGIGILIVLITDSFYPTRSEEKLRQALAARTRQLAADLGPESGGEGDPRPGAAATPSPLPSQLALLGAMRVELGASRSRADALEQTCFVLEAVASRVRVLRALVSSGSPSPAIVGAFTEARGRLAAALDEAAGSLGQQRRPAAPTGELEATLERLEATADAIAENPERRLAEHGRIAVLRDLLALTGQLEEVLGGSAHDSSQPRRSAAPLAERVRIRIDPTRARVALRTGIAVSGAILAVLILGWPMNSLIAPVAFMIASVPMRGGAMKTVLVVGATVLGGWLLADLASVYFYVEVAQMPLALLYPAVVAGALGYLGSARPALDSVRTTVTLLAVLPIFAGTSAPTNVYGPYSTSCYLALGLAIGWASTRLIWPATAAAAFSAAAASQLEWCGRALASLAREEDSPGRGQQLAAAAASATPQQSKLEQLHGQAQLEPLERALDGPRRAALVGRTRDLLDAVLGSVPGAPAARALASGGEALAPLREACRELEDAAQHSVQSTAIALRGHAVQPATRLGEARDRLRSVLRDLSPERATPGLLADIDARNRVISRLLEIEAWLADWQPALADEERG